MTHGNNYAALTRRHLLQLGGSAAALGACRMEAGVYGANEGGPPMTELVVYNGKITTLCRGNPHATALAIKDGYIAAVGSDRDIMAAASEKAECIDLKGRRVIPGLNDSHTHLIRGGLNYNMELRWENVPSLADALLLLSQQAERTPAPQWVRVVGGWSEFQFSERRMPTLEEINAAAPDTPVFILHLYGRALLNRAALSALGIGKDTPDPPGGEIQRDRRGNATGLLIARPSALILYSTLSQGPRLPIEDQVNSTRHFMRELNRLGITSVIDAGGGGQNYPEDYEVIERLHDDGLLTLRIAYSLFAQRAGSELSDYERWLAMTEPGAGDALFRMNGAGENLAWSAADFENFLEPRPTPGPVMESELEPIVELLANRKWPFRLHATYDETIDRFLGVIERVNGRQPLGARFTIDHAETISQRNMERVNTLGGGIAIQHRMAFQGEYFVDRYGAHAAEATPPVAQMLAMDIPVGAGTDATRVASYDPWVGLYWLTTGKTLGGLSLYPEGNTLDRETALGLYTHGSAWFSGEEAVKGRLTPGQYADLAVLSNDYFSIPAEDIRQLRSLLTIVAGKIVYAAGEFSHFDPLLPAASPSWSPVAAFEAPGSRYSSVQIHDRACHESCQSGCGVHAHQHQIAWTTPLPVPDTAKRAFWGALGCSCFAI